MTFALLSFFGLVSAVVFLVRYLEHRRSFDLAGVLFGILLVGTSMSVLPGV